MSNFLCILLLSAPPQISHIFGTIRPILMGFLKKWNFHHYKKYCTIKLKFEFPYQMTHFPTLHHNYAPNALGEGSSKNFVCGCACRTLIFGLLVPIFVPIYRPSIHQFQVKSIQFYSTWLFFFFFLWFAPNTSDLYNLGTFICDINGNHHHTKICEKASQKTGIYAMSMWEPPTPSLCAYDFLLGWARMCCQLALKIIIWLGLCSKLFVHGKFNYYFINCYFFPGLQEIIAFGELKMKMSS